MLNIFPSQPIWISGNHLRFSLNSCNRANLILIGFKFYLASEFASSQPRSPVLKGCLVTDKPRIKNCASIEFCINRIYCTIMNECMDYAYSCWGQLNAKHQLCYCSVFAHGVWKYCPWPHKYIDQWTRNGLNKFSY